MIFVVFIKQPKRNNGVKCCKRKISIFRCADCCPSKIPQTGWLILLKEKYVILSLSSVTYCLSQYMSREIISSKRWMSKLTQVGLKLFVDILAGVVRPWAQSLFLPAVTKWVLNVVLSVPIEKTVKNHVMLACIFELLVFKFVLFPVFMVCWVDHLMQPP